MRICCQKSEEGCSRQREQPVQMHFVLIGIEIDKQENVVGEGTGRKEPSEEGLKGAGLNNSRC